MECSDGAQNSSGWAVQHAVTSSEVSNKDRSVQVYEAQEEVLFGENERPVASHTPLFLSIESITGR